MTNIIAFLHTTAAYQSVALELMIGEANFAATELQLRDRVPPATNGLVRWEVFPPPMGVAGSIITTNFVYIFEGGRLTHISKRDWRGEAKASNLLAFAGQTNRLDTNTAFAFATQCLARLQVDLNALTEQPRYVLQVPVRRVDERGATLPGRENVVATPLFQISWGQRAPPFAMRNPVQVELLGTTPELTDVRLRDHKLSRRPALTVTNAVALLGSSPSPRHFVEELFGGVSAYETVASAERVDAWLLNTDFSDEGAKLPETRKGPVPLPASLAKQFAQTLLDFDTYHWRVTKLCSPTYGLKLRFVRGARVLEVRFCFDCDILEITFAGQSRTENFDFNHNEFVSIAKRLFPKDAEIRKLKADNDQRKMRKRFEEELKELMSQ